MLKRHGKLVALTGVSFAAAVGAGVIVALLAPGSSLLPFGNPPAGAVQSHDARVEFPDALSGLDEPVSHLASDQGSGDLWFVTYVPGAISDAPDIAAPNLHKYDRADDSLDSFPLPPDIGTGLWSGITMDDRAHVIVAYGYTIVDFDGSKDTYNVIKLPLKTEYPQEVPNQTGNWVTAIAYHDKGQLLVGRMGSAAITELDLATGSIVEYPVLQSFGPVVDMASTAGGVYLTNWFGFGYPSQAALFHPESRTIETIPVVLFNLAAGKDGSVFGTKVSGPGLAELNGTVANEILPSATAHYLSGTADLLAYDDAEDAVWFAAEGAGTIARSPRGASKVDVYQLPMQAIPGEYTRCIRVRATCPEEVFLFTEVGALAPDGSGGVYFSNKTTSSIGIAPPN